MNGYIHGYIVFLLFKVTHEEDTYERAIVKSFVNVVNEDTVRTHIEVFNWFVNATR